MANQGLIIVEQLPVITERLAELGEVIDAKITAALSWECTEQTVKCIKTIRAELTKELAEFENKRKDVKKAILTPYEAFEAVYKQFVSDKYRDADIKLKEQVETVENRLKQEKYEQLNVYFDEYCFSRAVDFVPINRWNPNVTLSVTLKSLKEQAKAYIDKVCDDLALIDTQEHKNEILHEYRQSLNVSQAITTVSERYKAIEEMTRRQVEIDERKAAEQQVIDRVKAFEAPKVAEPAPSDPVMTLTFKVTAPISKLKELKKFIIEGGYKYE